MKFLKKLFGNLSSTDENTILNQIAALNEKEDYQSIIDLVDGLTKSDKTPPILSEQARACNNLIWELDYDENGGHLKYLHKAIEILKSIEKEQGDDPIWNYRIGYAYFFLDDLEHAKNHLLKGDKEQSEEFLDIITYAETHSIPLEAAKAHFWNESYRYTSEEIRMLEDYIEQHFGKIGHVLHEIVSPDIHCDIYVIKPSEERNYYTLVTGGMGAYDMTAAEQFNAPTNAELVINLPADWNLESEAEKDYWPLRWLKILARLPIEQQTFLGWGHTIPTGEPLEGTNFTGFMLTATSEKNDDSAFLRMSDKREVYFYHIVPVYEQEMVFKLENDAGELLDLFNENGIPYPPVVDIHRPNVCMSFEAMENPALLDDVQWTFTKKEYPGLMPFFDDVRTYNHNVGNELENFNPFATMFQATKIKVMYDAWVQSKDDLLEHEIVTDQQYFEQTPQEGLYPVKIVATLESSGGNSFGALEVLFLVNNSLSNKELKGTSHFKGFEVLGEEKDKTPLLYLLLDSKTKQ